MCFASLSENYEEFSLVSSQNTVGSLAIVGEVFVIEQTLQLYHRSTSAHIAVHQRSYFKNRKETLFWCIGELSQTVGHALKPLTWSARWVCLYPYGDGHISWESRPKRTTLTVVITVLPKISLKSPGFDFVNARCASGWSDRRLVPHSFGSIYTSS